MSKILEVRNLDYAYQDGSNKRIIFENASLGFEEGTFTVILGESGSGKTTLLALLAGLDQPQGGTVLFRGQDIRTIGLRNYRRNEVALVFQNYQLIFGMNAIDNILLATSLCDRTKKVGKKEVLTLLEQVGISANKAERKVKKLSGGEQQRVAIARAIAVNSDLILADEPTGNLDWETSAYIVQFFQDLVKTYKKTVIMVTHNEQIALQADRIVRIDQRKKQLIYG